MKPLIDWINQQTPLLNDPVYNVLTKIYWIFNGITSWNDVRVKCPVCGKPFIGKNVIRLRLGYSRRCSVRCMNSDKHHVDQVVAAQKRHLDEDPQYWKKRNQKTKDTKVRKGLAENWVNPDKAKKTKMAKYGDPTFNNIDKSRRTRYSRNGGKWHGDDFSKKVQNTCLQNNGFKCPFASNGKRDQIDYNAARIKARDTMRRRGTFRKSKSEDECYELLCRYFGQDDVERCYKSKDYPFNCDFYVKSFDLYIEYNGTWTHGFHDFNPDDPNDVKRLAMLKQKVDDSGSKYYKSAIYVWTDLDPRKRRAAEDKNLNFMTFWTPRELESWLDENFLKNSEA